MFAVDSSAPRFAASEKFFHSQSGLTRPVWDDLARALALVLVVEGMWPFLAPARWRNLLGRVSQMPDRVVRVGGCVSMFIGLLLLQTMRS